MKKEVTEMDFFVKEKLPQEIGKEVDQIPTASQRKMILALADALTEEEYHELCHQLHGSKLEFDEFDGECSKPVGVRYVYTVQSALYRGVFWSTLEALDAKKEQKEQEEAFRRAEEEWLEPDEDF